MAGVGTQSQVVVVVDAPDVAWEEADMGSILFTVLHTILVR